MTGLSVEPDDFLWRLLASTCANCGAAEDLTVLTEESGPGAAGLAVCGPCLAAGEIPTSYPWVIRCSRGGKPW